MRRRVGVREKMNDWVKRKLLKWFSRVERMSEERLTESAYDSEVEGRRDRGRPCTSLLDAVEKAYHTRLLELSDANAMGINRQQWRDFVEGINARANV